MTKRNIDVNKLNDKQLETAVHTVSAQINAEVDVTCNKINELLKRYGLQCKMQIAIEAFSSGEIAKEHDKIKHNVSI